MEELGKKIDKLTNQVTDLRIELWTNYTLFTWQWWVLLVACIIMLVLFFLFIKKERLLSSIAYLGIIYILNKNLDDVATAMDWYDYRMQLEPIIPTMLPANLFIIPIGLTLLYDRFKKWKSYLIALALVSAFISYVALPMMKTVDIYLEKSWNANWSFISLVLIAVISKTVIDKVKLKYNSSSDL